MQVWCGVLGAAAVVHEVPNGHRPLHAALLGTGRLQRSQVESISTDAAGRTFALGTGESLRPANDTYHNSTHILLTLPRDMALTADDLRSGVLSYFLASPPFRAHLRQTPLVMPGTFVMALFFLFLRHSACTVPQEPMWCEWSEYHAVSRTGEHALFRWNEEELAALEEVRLKESADTVRESVERQFSEFMQPLSNAFPSFLPPEKIDLEVFARAVAVVTAQRVRVEGLDEDTLVPLPVRQHPASGNARFELVKQEVRHLQTQKTRHAMLVNLVTSDALPLKPGNEITLASAQWNDELLLERGYLWNQLSAASVPLRMWTPVQDGADDSQDRRRKLLWRKQLNETQDFRLVHGKVPRKLLIWSLISVGADEDVAALEAGVSEKNLPLVQKTVENVRNNLLVALDRVHAAFDHDVEEDELLLDSPSSLAPRLMLALQSRRLSKLVLQDTAQRIVQHLQDSQARIARLAAAERGGGANATYSTAKERKTQAHARSMRAKHRKRVRTKQSASQGEKVGSHIG